MGIVLNPNLINETKRSDLPDSSFGIPEDRKYPLDTKEHVQSAIKLFGHAEEGKKKSLAHKIQNAAKKYNIDIPENSQCYKYLHESISKDNILEEVKDFNKDLNKWSYGVLINGKVYTKSSEIDWSKYKTIPIYNIEKYHVGVCWDFVNYQHNWFKKNKIKDDSYFFVMQTSSNPNDIVTHTFSIITIDNTKYWFESSWFGHQGVKEIKSYKDVINELIEKYDKKHSNDYSVFKYSPDGLDNNISNGEFFKRATRNCIENHQNNYGNTN